MNKPNFEKATIIPGASHYEGLMIPWSTSGLADYQEIYGALKQEFGEDFAKEWSPEKPSDTLCLSKAVTCLSKSTYNIDNVRQGVWAVSLREKTEENSVGVKYMPQLGIHVQAEELVFSDDNHPLVATIKAKYDEVRRSIPSDNIRKVISTYFRKRADSVPMRLSGGVEYVPAKHQEECERYMNIMEQTTGASFTPVNVTFGASTILSLTNAVVAEAKAQIKDTQKAIDNGVGNNALITQIKHLYSAQQKLERYTEILGESFDGIDELVETCKSKVTDAMCKNTADKQKKAS